MWKYFRVHFLRHAASRSAFRARKSRGVVLRKRRILAASAKSGATGAAGKGDRLSSSRRENGEATLLVRISFSPFQEGKFSLLKTTSRHDDFGDAEEKLGVQCAKFVRYMYEIIVIYFSQQVKSVTRGRENPSNVSPRTNSRARIFLILMEIPLRATYLSVSPLRASRLQRTKFRE